MSTTVRLTDVSRRFSGTQGPLAALEGVSLEVMAGEFVALLGPSGCGKTTVLRLAAGLDQPSSGRVDVQAESGQAPRVSYVFQDATLMPWASVADNVWLPLRIAGVSRLEARSRMAPLLATLGLAPFAEALPHELSGGLRMRASIARALVTQPDLLLMDEPFAALDEITRQRLNTELLALWQALRCTVLFVTHSVFEATFLAQRVLVMSARPGRVAQALEVNAPYPRDTAWRLSPRFAQLSVQATEALEADAGAGR
jgi:NitT/TauT family transport system ATP-binding protein